MPNCREEIRVVVAGAGAMGKGIVYQCHITEGIRCIGLSDPRIERASGVAEWLGYEPVDPEHSGGADLCKGDPLMFVTEDSSILAELPCADVFIDASSSVMEAGFFCEKALNSGKHLVMMNAEADLIFGPYLHDLAKRNGVVYTSSDGDQHGVIKRMVDEISIWGFDIVMAGNIKGFLDRYSNPESIIPEADKRNLDYRMASAYTDGTKLCIEMLLLANALGLDVPRPGMTGPPAASVSEVPALFDLPGIWQRGRGVVDYILGAEPGGGVFVVGHCKDEYQRSMMHYYKMGPGPYYVFYRPYHLCHVEIAATIRDAAALGRPLLVPGWGFRTNVFSYAKKDLKKGEKLDGIGGFCCYGMIEQVPENGGDGLPICLAEGMSLKRDIPKNSRVLWEYVDIDGKRPDMIMFSKAQEASRNILGH